MCLAGVVSCHDLLSIVMKNLSHSPLSMVLFSMTSKDTFNRLQSEKWWETFYEWVIDHERSLKISKYLRRLNDVSHVTKIPKRLCLVYSKQCQFCGNKYGHHLLRVLGIRSCKQCIASKLVSNGTLYFRYGLSYYDFIEKYAADGGRIVDSICIDKVIWRQRNGDNALLYMQLRQYEEACDLHCIFFWKEDMERILGIKLNELESKQIERILAAQFLSTRLIRLSNTILDQKNPESSRLRKMRKQSYKERLRPYCRLKVPRVWMPGGAFYSYYDLNSPKKLTDFWWRPGFNFERFENVKRILNEGQNKLSKN
jgi:hypothetical protein